MWLAFTSCFGYVCGAVAYVLSNNIPFAVAVAATVSGIGGYIVGKLED